VLTDEADPALVRARQSSERLLATVRLAIIALLVTANALVLAWMGQLHPRTLAMSAAVLVYGLVLFLVPRRVTAAWLPWVTSAMDVLCATGVLLLLVAMKMPIAAINNRVTFETYFVAVTISALRFDWRLSAFTAALSVAGYLGVTAYAALRFDLFDIQSVQMGSFVPVQFVNRLVVLVGNGVAAVAVARWARYLRLMVGTDQLTGLLQRRPFLERIEEELARADLARTTLSIAIFDVDEFHEFNRRFGHAEGDRALVQVAEQLKLGVRTTDLLARYGGEEFVVAFPRLDVQLAAKRVEALRAAIEQALNKDGQGVTVSAGVASWPADGQDFEAVLKSADERLYAAKASGRNMVIGPLPLPVRSVAGEPTSA